MAREILGIDIGGSGIKGAPVAVEHGELLSERLRIPTPEKATPTDILGIIKQIVDHFQWKGPIGCGFPAAVIRGEVMTASNIAQDWIGTNVEQLITRATACPVRALNDADAAGLAMVRFGAARQHQGLVLVITVGTGLGTALFYNGVLVPNLEMGHIQLKGMDAEQYASDSTRKREDLSWKKWAKRFNRYLLEMEKLLWPELIILGGGVSRKGDRFMEYLTLRTQLITAELQNEAGIIGAALAAADLPST